jgi:hydrogenase maturation protease
VNVLVAGIGNIFFGDDGFGPEVVRALAAQPIEGVTIEDYGIRGMHLAYDLVSGYDRALLIDAVPRGGTPGTLYVIEPEMRRSDAAPDPHRMDLENVFAFVRTIGGVPPPITIVGCEPTGSFEEIGLTEVVRAAVGPAVELVQRLVAEALAAENSTERRNAVWTEA